MCSEIIELHKQRWLDRAYQKSGIAKEELARIYDGITLELFSCVDWPVVSPYNKVFNNLRDYTPDLLLMADKS